LGAPVTAGVDLNGSERVGFGTGLGHDALYTRWNSYVPSILRILGVGMRRFWLVAASIGLVFCTAPAFAQVESMISQATILARDYAVEQRCKRISSSGLLLLRFHRDELRANIVGLRPALVATLDKLIAESEQTAAQESCTHYAADPVVTSRLQRLELIRKITYTRAAAVLNLEQWLPYAARLTVLSQKKDAIRGVMDEIETHANLGWVWPDTINWARGGLADLCQERKAVRWTGGERPCPKLSVGEDERIFGATILKDIEAYVAADDTTLPPPVASPWNISFLVSDKGTPVCHIERVVGSARLRGDAGDGGVFSYTINTEFPPSISQPPSPPPARLTLEGYVGVDGLAAIIIEKAQLDLPSSYIGTPKDNPTMTIGTMKFSSRIEGNSLILDKTQHPGAGEQDLILLSAALVTTPHIFALVPGSANSRTVDAYLLDLKTLLLGMNTLRQAYRLCWR
ncbi:MAG TPA: hypothetical protein VJP60_06765, partial [Rhizomicrobium sp.]|nr:hypothetical protein [Rhizomicrobium sp.]